LAHQLASQVSAVVDARFGENDFPSNEKDRIDRAR
jgi:hypothetical protein